MRREHNNMTTYENPKFRKFQIDLETIELIKKIQNDYEAFYEKLKKNCSFNYEHELALQRLQESCMWFTRGVSQSYDYKQRKLAEGKEKTKIIIKKSKLGFKNDKKENS